MAPPVYKHTAYLHIIWLQTEGKEQLFFLGLYLHWSCCNDKPAARKEEKPEVKLGY